MDGQPVEQWAAALAGGDAEAQANALRQISSCDSVIGLTVPIVELAGSDDDEVRMWAAEAMEIAVRPAPHETTPLVRLLTESHDGEVCYWAATMLGRLGVPAAAAVDALKACLLGGDYLAARERCIWALSQIGPAAMTALPSLARIGDDDQYPRLQRLALKAIQRINRRQSSEAA